MSKSKRKDNFNQAMYEMFGIGRDTSVDTEEPEDEAAEFFGIDPLSDQEETPAPAPAPAVEPAPESKYEPAYTPAYQPPAYQAPVTAQREAPRNTRTTFLAEGTSIEGTLRCDSDVEICGDFKGDLYANGKIILHANTTSNVQAVDLALVSCNLIGDATVSQCITIDDSSNVTGNINAGDVVCSGVVRGNITVTGNLTLSSKAQVFGDIKAGSLVVERGGRVTGKMEMSG